MKCVCVGTLDAFGECQLKYVKCLRAIYGFKLYIFLCTNLIATGVILKMKTSIYLIYYAYF